MESLAKSDGSFCLAVSSEGRLRLREEHDYYYQVQGELNITKRQVCYFVGEWLLHLVLLRGSLLETSNGFVPSLCSTLHTDITRL